MLDYMTSGVIFRYFIYESIVITLYPYDVFFI